MRYYAGLDVAMKETFVCIMDEEGKKIYEGKSASDPQPIYEELAKAGVELEKAGMEAGSLSSYLIPSRKSPKRKREGDHRGLATVTHDTQSADW